MKKSRQNSHFAVESGMFMPSLDGNPVYSAILFPNAYGIPHGPLSSDNEVWEEMTKPSKHVPEKAKLRLQARMPSSTPFTFAHGDVANVNIMVNNGLLSGIIDWEAAGYFSVWWDQPGWEFTICCAICPS